MNNLYKVDFTKKLMEENFSMFWNKDRTIQYVGFLDSRNRLRKTFYKRKFDMKNWDHGEWQNISKKEYLKAFNEN